MNKKELTDQVTPTDLILNDCFDALVWAKEFVRFNPDSDQSLMHTWFANAIMTGYDFGLRKNKEQLDKHIRALAKARICLSSCSLFLRSPKS